MSIHAKNEHRKEEEERFSSRFKFKWNFWTRGCFDQAIRGITGNCSNIFTTWDIKLWRKWSFKWTFLSLWLFPTAKYVLSVVHQWAFLHSPAAGQPSQCRRRDEGWCGFVWVFSHFAAQWSVAFTCLPRSQFQLYEQQGWHVNDKVSHGLDHMFPIIHQGGWLKLQNRKWGGPIWFLCLILRPRF